MSNKQQKRTRKEIIASMKFLNQFANAVGLKITKVILTDKETIPGTDNLEILREEMNDRNIILSNKQNVK